MSTPAQRWSQLHHGIDPRSVPLVAGWLRAMWGLARPLARLRIPPTAITVLGIVLAVDAVLLARRAPWAAALAVLAAVLCDALDGAVAVIAGRATVLGAHADAVADRICDAAFAAVLWRCGAPWPLAVAAGGLAWAVDLFRRVHHVPARITVGERPSWTICAVLACAAATVSDARWPQVTCAVVWIVLGLVGVGQVVRG